jgi:prophage tail gpP-like protein
MELVVNNNRVTHFNSFELSLKFNAIASSFGTNFYFDPTKESHKELLRPGTYQNCKLFHEGELLLNGTILSSEFVSEPEAKSVSIGGYSKAGILEDCTIPVELYPLQTDGLSVLDIAKRLCGYFGIKVTDKSGSNLITKQIEESNAKEDQTIKKYLADLAAQRNVVLGHDNAGNVVFTRANVNGTPLFKIDEATDYLSAKLSFDGQGMFSSTTVLKEADDKPDSEPAQATETNNLVRNIDRPRVVVQSTGDEFDTKEAAKMAVNSNKKGVKLIISLDKWELDGVMVKPNNLIRVQIDDLFLFNPVNFFIESVNFVDNPEGKSAELTCVLPEVYGAKEQNVFA